MTRQYDPVRTETVRLNGAVVKNRFVTVGGLQTGLTATNVQGVAMYDGVAGDLIAVVQIGTAVVETSAAVAVGAECLVAGDGRLGAAGANGIARAKEAATGAGQFIEVELLPFRGA
ncbi:MAG: hypothetical protein ACKO0Z_25900 [Betaproteobacteria bacterium]